MLGFLKIFLPLIFLLILSLTGGCAGDEAEENSGSSGVDGGTGVSGELVVYSSRNENFVEPLLQKFQDETGINVRALHAGGAALNRIKEEGHNVQADIFISNDIGGLEHLRLEGFLQGYNFPGIETIESRYRAEDNSWFALSARTRVLMFNKDLITEGEMPGTVWELTDPRWKDQFAITRGGNSGMIGHVSALINEWGEEKTTTWIAHIKGNAGAIMQGHGDIRRSVGAGEFKFGLVNNYYFHQQLREPQDNNVGVVYPDQGEGEMGAVINAAGVGFVKGAPHPENAKKFLEWILLPENQREFSYASLEVPINPSIEAVGEAARITDYSIQGMPLRELGDVWEDTRKFIEQSGLDLEIR